MAVIYLVRHGQASWGAADYDVLSGRPRVGKPKKLWMALSNGVRMKLGV